MGQGVRDKVCDAFFIFYFNSIFLVWVKWISTVNTFHSNRGKTYVSNYYDYICHFDKCVWLIHLTFRVRNASRLAFSHTTAEYMILEGWCWLALSLSTVHWCRSVRLSKLYNKDCFGLRKIIMFKWFSIHFYIEGVSSLATNWCYSQNIFI